MGDRLLYLDTFRAADFATQYKQHAYCLLEGHGAILETTKKRGQIDT